MNWRDNIFICAPYGAVVAADAQEHSKDAIAEDHSCATGEKLALSFLSISLDLVAFLHRTLALDIHSHIHTFFVGVRECMVSA